MSAPDKLPGEVWSGEVDGHSFAVRCERASIGPDVATAVLLQPGADDVALDEDHASRVIAVALRSMLARAERAEAIATAERALREAEQEAADAWHDYDETQRDGDTKEVIARLADVGSAAADRVTTCRDKLRALGVEP